MSKFEYLMIWAIINISLFLLLEYCLDVIAWKTYLIFFLGNMTGMLCEYIGNDLRILNQDRK